LGSKQICKCVNIREESGKDRSDPDGEADKELGDLRDEYAGPEKKENESVLGVTEDEKILTKSQRRAVVTVTRTTTRAATNPASNAVRQTVEIRTMTAVSILCLPVLLPRVG
jgi:hypothetical protein